MTDKDETNISNKSKIPGRKPGILRRAFDTYPGDVVSLVGAGGKTTLMFALARELADSGEDVITTTTTKIMMPDTSNAPCVLVEKNEPELEKEYLAKTGKYRHITLAREHLSSDKLAGVTPAMVDRISRLNRDSFVIVEADGAARRPLKAPNATEPVIPGSTSLLIPVVGIDALGARLDDENVFRAEIAAALIGKAVGGDVSADDIALLVTHPQGIIKGSPRDTRIIPFINKVDGKEELALARKLAVKILAARHPRIERVVLGRAESPGMTIEIIMGDIR